MIRTEIIGDATLYWELSRSQRYRLRKAGLAIPRKPMPSGYKQSAEHVEKRKRAGADSFHWIGDAVSVKGGRSRAQRQYKNIGPCIACGAVKAERHHKDGDTSNNEPGNVAALCRRCHMEADGRLAKCREWAACAKKSSEMPV